MRAPDQMPPIAIGLKTISAALGITQRELAEATGLGLGTVSEFLNSGVLPKRADRTKVQESVRALCHARNASARQMAGLFKPAITFKLPKEKAAKAVTKAASHQPTHQHSEQEIEQMLLAKQALTQHARKAFALFNNPFDGEVTSAGEMFQNTEFRYCREACWQAANHGRFVAVVGESGAGKTTLLGDLEDRIDSEHKQVVLIKPSVLGMEDNDKAGKTLKASGIMDSIVFTLDPLVSPKRGMEAKTRQLQRMLEDSAKAGNVHLLVIEEAHALPVNTLKHLKRLHELRMGRRPLLGILLLGQPELKAKLSEKRHDVREVVQRCEVVELMPLDADLRGYISTRLQRDGKSIKDVLEDDAVEAIRARLTVVTDARGGKQGNAHSLVYPLAVNNFMTAAINIAAELGAPLVTRDVVMGV